MRATVLSRLIGGGLLATTGVVSGVPDDVRLVGTVVGPQARAIIEVDQRQRVVRLGDRLREWRVVAIGTSSVVLVGASRRKRVRLTAGAIAEERMGEAGAPLPPIERHRVHRPWIERLLGDRQRLVNAVTLEPVVADGVLNGYRVGRLAPDSELSGLGVRQGDVIVAVNDVPVAQPAAFMRTVRRLDDASAVQLAIEREGRRRHLYYDLVMDAGCVGEAAACTY